MDLSNYTIHIPFFYGRLPTCPVGVKIWINCGQSFFFWAEEDTASFKNLQVLWMRFYNVQLSWGVTLLITSWERVSLMFGHEKHCPTSPEFNCDVQVENKQSRISLWVGSKSKSSPTINVTPLRVKSNSFTPYISVSAIWGVIFGSLYLHLWKYKKCKVTVKLWFAVMKE